MRRLILLMICLISPFTPFHAVEGLPLYYWKEGNFINFGDHLSLKIVERMVRQPVKEFVYLRRGGVRKERKLLALGSIFYFAKEGDVVWGTGINGKTLKSTDYIFQHLDVRAVRGPLTRRFLMTHFDIDVPEIYGDPALLMPYLFPEFKRKEHPRYDYLIIPHYSETKLFPKHKWANVVYPTEPWDVVIEKILDSRFVISSSLHGIIVAEAFGIPARMLRVTQNEKLFKYEDYYLSTGRADFRFATSVEEALVLGGEVPFDCDLEKLYNAFPFEFWPTTQIEKPPF